MRPGAKKDIFYRRLPRSMKFMLRNNACFMLRNMERSMRRRGHV
jgi:hypothetical protein